MDATRQCPGSGYESNKSYIYGDHFKDIQFSWLGLEIFVCCLAHWGSIGVFLLLQIVSDVVRRPGLSIAGHLIVSVCPRFLFILYISMFVCP